MNWRRVTTDYHVMDQALDGTSAMVCPAHPYEGGPVPSWAKYEAQVCVRVDDAPLDKSLQWRFIGWYKSLQKAKDSCERRILEGVGCVHRKTFYA